MFTGSTIWLLTHGRFLVPPVKNAPLEELSPQVGMDTFFRIHLSFFGGVPCFFGESNSKFVFPPLRG